MGGTACWGVLVSAAVISLPVLRQLFAIVVEHRVDF